jgi:Tfp pilus assembly protein PilO
MTKPNSIPAKLSAIREDVDRLSAPLREEQAELIRKLDEVERQLILSTEIVGLIDRFEEGK